MANKFDILFDIDMGAMQGAFKEIEGRIKHFASELQTAFSLSDSGGLNEYKDLIEEANKGLKNTKGLLSEVNKSYKASEKVIDNYYKSIDKDSREYYDHRIKQINEEAALIKKTFQARGDSGANAQLKAQTFINSEMTKLNEKQYAKDVSEAIKANKKKENLIAKYYNSVKFQDTTYIQYRKGLYTKELNDARIYGQERVRLEAQMNKQLIAEQSKYTTKAVGAFDKIGASIRNVVLAGGISVIIYQIRNLVSAVVDMGRQFGDTMAGVKAIAGATASEFSELSNKARELGQNTRYTAVEVAALEQNYARLGFTTKEILAASDATVALAAATGEDLAQAAEIAGFTIRGFQLSATETQRIVDVMAKSFTSSALNLERFAESMKLIAPIARTVGFSVENTTTLLAKLADTGIVGSRAGTALRNVLSQIRDESSKVSQVLGGTAGTWDEFVTLLQRAKERGQEFKDEALNELDLRIKNVVISLSDMSGSLTGFSNEMDTAAGSANKMAEIRLDTLHGDILLMKSAFTEMGLALFDGVAPALRFIIKGFTILAKINPEIITLTTRVISLGIAIKLLRSELRKTIATNIANYFLRTGASIMGMVSGVTSFKTAMIALRTVLITHPIFALAAIIGGVTLAMHLLTSETKEAKEAQEALATAQKNVADSFADSSATFELLVLTYERLRGEVNKTAAEQELYVETINELQKNYPRFLSNLDLEAEGRLQIAEAIQKTREALEEKMLWELKEESIKSTLKSKVQSLIREKEESKKLFKVEQEISKLREVTTRGGIAAQAHLFRSRKNAVEQIEAEKKLQKELTEQTQELQATYEEVSAEMRQGVALDIDTSRTLNKLTEVEEKVKSLMKLFKIETEIEIFNFKDFKEVASLTFNNALEGSKAFKSMSKSFNDIADSEGVLDFFGKVKTLLVDVSNFSQQVKPRELFGVDWIDFGDDFTKISDTVLEKVRELQDRMRAGEELKGEEKEYLEFYNKILAFNKDFFEKRAKARGDDVKDYSEYSAIIKEIARKNVLKRLGEITLSKKRFEEAVKYEIIALQKGNKKKRKLVEQLRKDMEAIEARTSGQGESAEETKLRKINEYYENRIALLGGIGDLTKKASESDVEFLQRLEERKTLNARDELYALKLLAIKELQAKGEEVTNKTIEERLAIFKKIDRADKSGDPKLTEALELAKINIIKSMYNERYNLVVEQTEKQLKAVEKLESEYTKLRGQSQVAQVSDNYNAQIKEARTFYDKLRDQAKTSQAEIDRLSDISTRTDEQDAILSELQFNQNKQLDLIQSFNDRRVLLQKIRDEKLSQLREDGVEENKRLISEIEGVQESALARRFSEIEKEQNAEIDKWRLVYRATDPILKDLIANIEEYKNVLKQAATDELFESLTPQINVSFGQEFISTIVDLESKWDSLRDAFKKGLTLGNLADAGVASLDLISKAMSGVFDIMNQYYDVELEKINRNKDEKLAALEEAKEREDMMRAFTTEAQQEARDLEDENQEALNQAELNRIAEKYSKNVEFEDKWQLRKANIEAKALADEKEIKEKQKQMSIAQATISGAVAAVKALELGPILGPIMAGVIAAMTIAQIGVINSQKFAKGGYSGDGTYRDETGEKVAGVVHEKEMIFEKGITLPNLKSLFSLRKLLQKGYKLDDIMKNGLGNNFKLPNITIPTTKQIKFAEGGLGQAAIKLRNETSSMEAQLDELIKVVENMNTNIVENRPQIQVVAETIAPIIVEDLSEEGRVLRGID